MKLDVSFSENNLNISAKMSDDRKSFATDMGETNVVHDGQNGATFTPSVSEDGILSWTNDRELPNPDPVNIKGAGGDPGQPGKDGYTPVKGVDYFDGLPGPKGNPGQPGQPGAPGKDGYTPIKGVDYFDGQPGQKGDPGQPGAPGEKGDPGKDGYTPVRGTDYWTEADKAEIKSYVDEAILGGEW